jgi:hypothetical protein
MSRRSFDRFTVTSAAGGVLRVIRNVTVQRSTDKELVVHSTEPGVVSEKVFVGVQEARGPQMLSVRIAESRPIVAEGGIRYRLRLEVLQAADAAFLQEDPGEAFR